MDKQQREEKMAKQRNDSMSMCWNRATASSATARTNTKTRVPHKRIVRAHTHTLEQTRIKWETTCLRTHNKRNLITIKLFVHIIHVILRLPVRYIAQTTVYSLRAYIPFALVVLGAVRSLCASQAKPSKIQQKEIKCYRILIIYQFSSVARGLQHMRRERATKNTLAAEQKSEQTNASSFLARETRMHTTKIPMSLSPSLSLRHNGCRNERVRKRPEQMMLLPPHKHTHTHSQQRREPRQVTWK